MIIIEAYESLKNYLIVETIFLKFRFRRFLVQPEILNRFSHTFNQLHGQMITF